MVVNGQTVPTPTSGGGGRIFHRPRTTVVPTENGDRHGTAHNPDVAMHASFGPALAGLPGVGRWWRGSRRLPPAASTPSQEPTRRVRTSPRLYPCWRHRSGLAGQPGLGQYRPGLRPPPQPPGWRCTTSPGEQRRLRESFVVGRHLATTGPQAWGSSIRPVPAVDRTGRRAPV